MIPINRIILNKIINKKLFYSTSVKSNEAILKSKPYLITTLKLNKDESNEQILNNLKKKISVAPSFYNNAPIVLDISEYDNVEINQLEQLFKLCENNGLLPIGISSQNTTKEVQDTLKNFKLPLLSPKLGFTNNNNDNKINNDVVSSSPSSNIQSNTGINTIQNTNEINNINYSNTHQQPIQVQPPQPQQFNNGLNINNNNNNNNNGIYNSDIIKQSPLVITGSLRSGQQAYANNGTDLIVMGNVHSGAEAIADGNIYIFGTLKGRAHAGVSNDINSKKSKIIVNKFQGELVSIGSIYHACEVQPRLQNPKNPTTIELNEMDKLIFSSSNDILSSNNNV